MKHLVCLIDGTWTTAFAKSSFGEFSNIYKLNLHLKNTDRSGNPQVTFYVPGMGSSGGRYSRLRGGFGIGLMDSLEAAYVNIASNFERGDKVYLFGFSRGAVVARVVAGLISKFGIIEPEYVDKFRDFVKRYLSEAALQKDNVAAISSDDIIQKTSPQIRDRFIKSASVEFLGVFDTVFGHSIFSDNLLRSALRKDTRVPAKVKYALHLLSSDERRRKFEPNLWSGLEDEDALDAVEQIWLPGVHGDVGGLYKDDLIGDAALLTMIDRIEKHTDLSVYRGTDQCRRKVNPKLVVNGYESLWANLLYYFGKPRVATDECCQSLHPIYWYASRGGVKKKVGLRWKNIKKGEYALPMPNPIWAKRIEKSNYPFVDISGDERLPTSSAV